MNPPVVLPIIIPATEPQNDPHTYTPGVHQEITMIALTTIISVLIFMLTSISPLLVTDETQDIVLLK